MISCKKAAELTCQSLDRRLSLGERFKLRTHLLMCKACNAFRKQSIELDRLLNKRFHSRVSDEEFQRAVEHLPGDSCNRIKQRLREVVEQ